MLRLGKSFTEKLAYLTPTLTCYGAAAGMGLLYFTDWKAVLQYVPIVNGKFKTE